MSTVDEQTSLRIGDAVAAKGGRFLEAPVSGSKKPAIDGQLIILCAGRCMPPSYMLEGACVSPPPISHCMLASACTSPCL